MNKRQRYAEGLAQNGVIVDDQYDESVTTKRSGIEQVWRGEANVRNGFAASAGGKVFHWIDLGRLTEGFYDTALNEASDV